MCSFLQLCIVKSQTMSNYCNIYSLNFTIQAVPAAIGRSMDNGYGKERVKDFNHYGSSIR